MTINSLVGTRSQGKCCYLLLTLFAKDNIVKIFSVRKPVSIYKTVSLLSTDTAVFATRLSIRAFSIPTAFSAVMFVCPIFIVMLSIFLLNVVGLSVVAPWIDGTTTIAIYTLNL
jgi:hypothetical protein